MAKIHFLNVGHGDCTVIEHNNGNLSVIDINNGSDDMDDESVDEITATTSPADRWLWKAGLLSETELLARAQYTIPLTNPVSFLRENYPGKSIFRYIQTHPDFDHLRGLASLKEKFNILNFWDHPHTKEHDGIEHLEGDSSHWNCYQEFRDGKHCKVLHLYRGATGKYYNDGDDGVGGNGIHILGPTTEFRDQSNKDEDWNNMSYVLEYRTGDFRIVFGGDAEGKAWDDILNHYGENGLKCDVLKASHHGRDTGYHQKAVKAMSPTYTIVSVGKKPETDATNKYKQYSERVWSTRWYGNITLEISNGKMTWTGSRVS